MGAILVLNCGSSSIKYQLIDSVDERVIAAGKRERIEPDGGHAAALEPLLSELSEHKIEALGHRVVHGGPDFFEATLIDESVEAAIERCVPLAPLHNPANLAGIRAAQALFPDVPHVAVFDTAFHARLPRRASTYALDPAISGPRRIRRYGFHGTSHAFVSRAAARWLERDISSLRLISCHLGNGASVAAIEFGHSVETSMGVTPLEGLVMGTRSGDLDPGVVLSLARDLGIDETDDLLNRRSGLAGVSGLGNDLREIEEQAAEGHDRARLAINVFAHRVRKYIGAYAATMGGVDAIIMTGGIGENSQNMRRRILQRLDFLGLAIDEDRNVDATVSHGAPVFDISAEKSRVRSLVIATNEELEIARQTARIGRRDQELKPQRTIPIAISGRHVHLDRQTMDLLFGPGSELTEYKAISQPGQFASEQTVNLVGPRSRIDGVRVLGPLRSKSQIEVSRTDEFRLGVDAPIRRSGQLEGSAPITLEGPLGTVHLKEGLICAARHIHMTPADAESFGVENGDHVEVRIEGGPRDLTFGDVLVRVKDSYVLEMHIDTDEANAAELSRGAEGDLVYTAPKGQAAACIYQKRY
jgi:acetate kinase